MSEETVVSGYYYNSKFYEDEEHETEITPEAGKTYEDIPTGKTYTWSQAYTEVLSDGDSIFIVTDRDVGNTTASLVEGKVPASELPSYVDDVEDGYYYGSKFYADSGHTQEIAPEAGKIYIDLHTNRTYRWSGTAYAMVGGDNPPVPVAPSTDPSAAGKPADAKLVGDALALKAGSSHTHSSSDIPDLAHITFSDSVTEFGTAIGIGGYATMHATGSGKVFLQAASGNGGGFAFDLAHGVMYAGDRYMVGDLSCLGGSGFGVADGSGDVLVDVSDTGSGIVASFEDNVHVETSGSFHVRTGGSGFEFVEGDRRFWMDVHNDMLVMDSFAIGSPHGSGSFDVFDSSGSTVLSVDMSQGAVIRFASGPYVGCVGCGDLALDTEGQVLFTNGHGEAMASIYEECGDYRFNVGSGWFGAYSGDWGFGLSTGCGSYVRVSVGQDNALYAGVPSDYYTGGSQPAGIFVGSGVWMPDISGFRVGSGGGYVYVDGDGFLKACGFN